MRSLNFKKLLYQLHLEKDGTVSHKNNLVLKAQDTVSVITSPSGKEAPLANYQRLGLSKFSTVQEAEDYIRGEQGQKRGWRIEEKPSSEVEKLASGRKQAPKKATKGKKIEESVDEYLDKEQTEVFPKLKSPSDVISYLKLRLDKMTTRPLPTVESYAERFPEAFNLIKNGLESRALVRINSLVAENISEEQSIPLKEEKKLDQTPREQPKQTPKKETESVTKTDESKKQEETLEQSLTRGTFNRIRAILYGNNPAFTRFCEEKAKKITDELKRIAREGKTELVRSLANAEIAYMERLSPATHRGITAESLGMSEEQFVEALFRFEQVSKKTTIDKNGKKVEIEVKENPFDRDGKLLPEFRKNIDAKQLAEHLLKEKYADNPELVDSVLRYSEGGPFSLDDYINDYAESGTNPAQIKRNPRTSIDVDSARIDFLTESLVTTTSGEELSISDIISLERKADRRNYAQKALEEIEKRLEESKDDKSIKKITLETTKTLLEKYISDGSQKYPPIEKTPSGERVFEVLRDLKEVIFPQTEVFTMLFSWAGSSRGLFQKYENALSFSGNIELVKMNTCSLSELIRASKNITALGWDGDKIHPEIYAQIEESLDSEQRKVLENLESERLKNQYLAVVFSNDTYKFPIPATFAFQAKLSSSFDLPNDALFSMEEQEAEKERNKILEIKKSIPSAVYKAAYDFGNALLKNQDFDTAVGSFFEIIKENNPNITDEHLDKIKDFLKKTKKTSKKGSAKIGAFAESAVYAVMALQSIPSGGSIDFSISEGMNILSISDSNGIPVLDFCDHGQNSGLCDMAIIPFKDGAPSCIVSSELKIYDKGKPEIASFKELLGFSKIINFYRSRTESGSIGFAGCQQEDMTNNGQQMNFDSGSGYTVITGNSDGYVKPTKNRR